MPPDQVEDILAIDTPAERTFKQTVLAAIESRRRWAEMQRQIVLRKGGARPRVKQKPYPNAPNFVVPIIDDVVREKTDTEVSMLWNAPVMVHALPLSNSDQRTRQRAARALDSYVRYIIEFRPKIEAAFNTRNARGMAIFKTVRRFNQILRTEAPDVDVVDPFDVIVPDDARIDIEPDWIVHILRLTPFQLRKNAEDKGWQNVEQVIVEARKIASREDHDVSGGSSGGQTHDILAVKKSLIGLTTTGVSAQTPLIVVWEVYRRAPHADTGREIKEGDKVREIICPDCDDLFIQMVPWREDSSTKALTDEEFARESIQAAQEQREPQQIRNIPGIEREWPFYQAPFEYETLYWYDTRGAGHLVMDDQIEATAMKNAKAVATELSSKPYWRGTKPKNFGSFAFRPGEWMPKDAELVPPSTVAAQFDVDINSAKATAGRRVGASGQFNFSSQVGKRQVEKTATEVATDSARGDSVSSASVERMNDPISKVFRALWADLDRMGLKFPVFLASGDAEPMDDDIYKEDFLMIAAGNSKTLNPDLQLNRAKFMFDILIAASQANVPVNIGEALSTMLSMYDPRMTANWMLSEKEKLPLEKQIELLMQQMQMMAQGSQDLKDFTEQSVSELGKLAIENSENIQELKGDNGNTQQT